MYQPVECPGWYQSGAPGMYQPVECPGWYQPGAPGMYQHVECPGWYQPGAPGMYQHVECRLVSTWSSGHVPACRMQAGINLELRACTSM